MSNHKAILESLHNAVTVAPSHVTRFFKTTPGAYSAHDRFLGVTVPAVRTLAKQYIDASPDTLSALLKSPFNEARLLALIILVHQYQKADALNKERIYQFFMHNLSCVNNWNLVDSCAHLIVGPHVATHNKLSLLTHLAQSPDLWERRIAIVATWYFIKKDDLAPTFHIAQLLLNDTHDLIHKATGWMLREAGKRDQAALVAWLQKHYQHMPKTMARYAMERLTTEQKQHINKIVAP